ncbi:MAG: FkbM family methyltransferase [Crenarchaeota archaeon]|nr:FkbM family methyltransferase [Thermoproteota archaeon]
MHAEDVEYLAWLIESSEGCLSPGSVAALVDAALEGEGLVEVEVARYGYRLLVPADQLPEAWANLVHVVCMDEYMLSSLRGYRVESVVDIGGFLGFSAVHLANMLKPRRLLVYEPNPDAARVAELNIEANLPQGIDFRLYRAAVAEEDGEATLWRPPNWANSSLHRAYAEEMGVAHPEPLKVKTVAFKRAVLEAAPAAVKLDVEGVEDRLLRAYTPSPSEAPILVVEVHPPTSPGELQRLLEARGYRCSSRVLNERQAVLSCRAGG